MQNATGVPSTFPTLWPGAPTGRAMAGRAHLAVAVAVPPGPLVDVPGGLHEAAPAMPHPVLPPPLIHVAARVRAPALRATSRGECGQ